MRNTPRLLLASLLLAACGGTDSSGTPSGGTQTSGGTSTATTSTTTTSTTTTTTSTTTSAPADTQRAQLAREMLETCTPEGAGILGGTPVEIRVTNTLGGCGFRAPAAAPTERTLDFDVFSETAYVREHLACDGGREPAFDFAHTSYGRFASAHASNERFVVAWSVDDGNRVHVGMRLERGCERAGEGLVADAQGIEVPGRDRPVTLHRCTPVRAQCAR